jgi:capsular exopolysaccharide synthesis family protein
LNEANGKLADLRAKRAQLLVTATEKWPEVKEVERQIEVVAQHISDLKKQGSEQAVAKSKAKLREAQIREQAQRTVFEQERAVVQTRNSASVTYRLMQQEVDTNRKILNGLLETVGTNEANKAVSINNLRVVDYAISPDKTKPQGPMRLAYIAIAGFLSLAFGIAGALLLGHLDDRVWSEKDLYDMVNVRPLGVISSAAAGSLSFPRRRSSADSRTLITHQRNFLMAEDFRRLRTSVFRAATRSPRTVLVTSSIAGEGKTTTAANVAISLARGGANTVLVDADLHCPRQHLIFGLDNQAGLSSLLTGAAPMSDVDRLVHRDSSTGLSVLPCGPGINDPAEHLAGDRFRQLLANLTRRYECVIVDAPSVESCVDALLLAPHVDGVLMVVQTGKSQRDLVRRACHDIEAAGGTILGVILNRVHDPARKRYLYAPAAGPQVS